jgi:hypothetical protein
VIADQARMRHDLPVLGPAGDLVAELRLLVAQRADLVGDRTRTLNRLRQHLTAVCRRWNGPPSRPARAAGWCCWPATNGRRRSAALVCAA